MGVLALLGRSVPSQLRIFLLGVAEVDDIGSILVIAVFYTEQLNITGLVWAFALLAIIVIASRVAGPRVKGETPYPRRSALHPRSPASPHRPL